MLMMQSSNCPPLSRRESRRQDRRDAILTVAGRSFLENGYAGTTMSAIAAELGGSKGTLWSYFPSKEELFAAVVDRETAVFRSRLSAILNPCGDMKATLERFCRSFLERVTADDAVALYRLVIGEAGRFPEVGNIFFASGPRQTIALLSAYLAGAMERGLLQQADPAAAARSLTSLCMSGSHQQLVMGPLDKATPEMLEADIVHAMTVFLRAYAA